MQISVQIHLCPFFIHPGNELFDLLEENRRKKKYCHIPSALQSLCLRCLSASQTRSEAASGIWYYFFFLCFGSRRNECNSLWEEDGEGDRSLSLAQKVYRPEDQILSLTNSKEKEDCHFTKNKVVTFIYNDKFIMYSDSWRYHLIIIDSIAEAVSE